MIPDPRHRTSALRRCAFLIATGLASLPALPASGQDALGGGNVLDRNLNTQAGPFNAPVGQINFRARNLLVTGDVAGGRGFRGTVGYTAPSDFRGVAGSDATYQFRSNAAFSNPELFRYGHTFQQLRFGQDLGLLLYRRPTTGTTPRSLLYDQLAPGQINSAQRQVERMSIASSVQAGTDRLVQPQLVGGVVTAEEGRMIVHSSSLQGVYAAPDGRSVGLLGLGTMDLVRMQQDGLLDRRDYDPGREFEPKFEREMEMKLQTPPTAERPRATEAGAAATVEGDPGSRVDYRRIMDSISDRYLEQSGAPPAATGADVSTTAIGITSSEVPGGIVEQRQTPPGTAPPTGTSEIPPNALPTPPKAIPPDARPRTDPLDRSGATTGPTTGAMTGTTTPGGLPGAPIDRLDSSFHLLRERLRNSGESPPAGQLPPLPPPTPATGEVPAPPDADEMPMPDLAAVLRHGESLQRLAGDGKDRVSEVLRQAEAALRERAYFRAERRFDHVLRITPGHPFALAGLAHAQLGAGVYVSAGATLRKLFTDHPEMIDVRYDAALLPDREMLMKRRDALAARMDAADATADEALLLAYAGRALADDESLDAGLAARRRLEPDSPLTDLVVRIWRPVPAP